MVTKAKISQGERKGRYTPENQQEDLGIAQFAVLMAKQGWPFTLLSRDTGEDLMARIFEKGNATGVDFLVQHKSKRRWYKSNGILKYRPKVKDLIHWRRLNLPVILIVWDVNKDAGRWLLVQDVVRELDRNNPTWDNKASVTLSFPSTNSTDEKGLRLLHWELGKYYMLRNPDKEGLAFSLNPESGYLSPSSKEAVDRFYRFGDKVELVGEEIKAIEFPELWTRHFGSQPPRNESVIEIFQEPSELALSFRFDLRSVNARRISIGSVEMKRIKGGKEQVIFSNEHQNSQLLFTITNTYFPESDVNGKRANIKVNVRLREHIENEHKEQISYSATTNEANEAMEFLDILAEGGMLRLTLLEKGEKDNPKPFIDIPITPNPQIPSDENRQRVRGFFSTLRDAEFRFGVTFTLQRFRFSDSDLEAAEELQAIFLSGRYIENRNWTLSLTREGCLTLVAQHSTKEWKDGDSVSFRVTLEDAYLTLLGTKLTLGSYEGYVAGPLELTLKEIEARALEMKKDESMDITLINARINHTFFDWLPQIATV